MTTLRTRIHILLFKKQNRQRQLQKAANSATKKLTQNAIRIYPDTVPHQKPA